MNQTQTQISFENKNQICPSTNLQEKNIDLPINPDHKRTFKLEIQYNFFMAYN